MVADVTRRGAFEGGELGVGDVGEEAGLRSGVVFVGEEEVAGAGDDEGVGVGCCWGVDFGGLFWGFLIMLGDGQALVVCYEFGFCVSGSGRLKK